MDVVTGPVVGEAAEVEGGGGRRKNCSGGSALTDCARDDEAECGERGKNAPNVAAAADGDSECDWPPLLGPWMVAVVLSGDSVLTCGGCSRAPKGGDSGRRGEVR